MPRQCDNRSMDVCHYLVKGNQSALHEELILAQLSKRKIASRGLRPEDCCQLPSCLSTVAVYWIRSYV